MAQLVEFMRMVNTFMDHQNRINDLHRETVDRLFKRIIELENPNTDKSQ